MCATKQRIAEINADLQAHLSTLGEAWIPQRRRILGAPVLLPGEAFSSWCWRIAVHTRVPVDRILGCFGISTPSFWLDAGRGNFDLSKIAIVTMAPLSTLHELRWAAKSILALPYFACLTTDPLNRRPIYRYCEACLRSDLIPYIRRFWRLGGANMCPIHWTVLRDHCPHCKERLDLSHGPSRRNRSIRQCSRCRGDLCKVDSVHLPEALACEVLAQQSELIRLIAGDAGPVGEGYWSPPRQAPVLIRDVRGNIDMFERGNVMSLLSSVLSSYSTAYAGVPTRNQCIEEIRYYLSFVGAKNELCDGPRLAVGLSGPRIFKWNSKRIAAYLHSCLDLRAGTHWRRLNVGTPLQPPTATEARVLAASIAWVRELGRSRPGSSIRETMRASCRSNSTGG